MKFSPPPIFFAVSALMIFHPSPSTPISRIPPLNSMKEMNEPRRVPRVPIIKAFSITPVSRNILRMSALRRSRGVASFTMNPMRDVIYGDPEDGSTPIFVNNTLTTMDMTGADIRLPRLVFSNWIPAPAEAAITAYIDQESSGLIAWSLDICTLWLPMGRCDGDTHREGICEGFRFLRH
jgi:hypothetical protein